MTDLVELLNNKTIPNLQKLSGEFHNAYYVRNNPSPRIYLKNINISKDKKNNLMQGLYSIDIVLAQMSIISKLWNIDYDFISKNEIWLNKELRSLNKKALYSCIFGMSSDNIQLMYQDKGFSAFEFLNSELYKTIKYKRNKYIESLKSWGGIYSPLGEWIPLENPSTTVSLVTQSYEILFMKNLLSLINIESIYLWNHDEIIIENIPYYIEEQYEHKIKSIGFNSKIKTKRI